MDGVLQLEVRDYTSPACWRWVLTDAAGDFIAAHEILVHERSSEYESVRTFIVPLWHRPPPAGPGYLPRSRRPAQPSITVAVFRSVTVLQLSVAPDSWGAATYRHHLSAGPVQAARAASRVL
jgi:hypothetical protein